MGLNLVFNMDEYQLDKTKHWAGKMEDQEKVISKYWQNQSIDKRFKAAWYLTCKAYGIDPNNPPSLDRTAFKAGKRN